MRNIKFRAWDKKKKEMVKVTSLEFAQDDSGDMLVNWDDDKKILMQYAGLKDKKGVEIYEGDIVKLFANKLESNFNENPSVMLRVEWYSNPFSWALIDVVDGCYFSGLDERLTMVVKGNIYENPELNK